MIQDRMTDVVTVCERKTFTQLLFSGFGVFMLIFGVLTFGFMFLLLLALFYATPKRVWIQDNKLFSDKKLPKNGVPLESIRLNLLRQTFLFIQFNRVLTLYFTADNGKQRGLPINDWFFADSAVDYALATFGYVDR